MAVLTSILDGIICAYTHLEHVVTPTIVKYLQQNWIKVQFKSDSIKDFSNSFGIFWIIYILKMKSQQCVIKFVQVRTLTENML